MAADKVKSLEALAPILRAAQARGRKVVFTNGCFDLLHRGHVRYLAQARALGDLLVVGLNSDASVQALKGPARPIVPADDRAEVLAALEAVDFVTVFEEPTPERLIAALQPDILVKGGDWTPDTIVGRETVERRGGQVRALPYVDGASTSGLIERILALFGPRRP
ncbi:MAG TPA: D-glycero-beta-D-manno-heptose 1-phosphate adenylyltransferase [Candidatus Sulfotelmatobacter sp.]|nr:D-glycero-beta-D-manno-heptose 1-phosphate adenylyltransferase [Candidatus Sulfotelmatobacter sp.]